MVDTDKVLKNTIKSGKVKIGTKETESAIKKGAAKLVVISNNCPYSTQISNMASKKKIPVYNYESNSIVLGTTCGKTFAVSVFAVLDDGGSNILSLVKKR